MSNSSQLQSSAVNSTTETRNNVQTNVVYVHNNLSEPLGKAKFNQLECEFLFDTGSPVTLMSENFWNQVKRQDSVTYCKLSVWSCGGNKVNVIDSAICAFDGYETQRDINVLVVAGLSHKVILGLDVCETLNHK